MYIYIYVDIKETKGSNWLRSIVKIIVKPMGQHPFELRTLYLVTNVACLYHSSVGIETKLLACSLRSYMYDSDNSRGVNNSVTLVAKHMGRGTKYADHIMYE